MCYYVYRVQSFKVRTDYEGFYRIDTEEKTYTDYFDVEQGK